MNRMMTITSTAVVALAVATTEAANRAATEKETLAQLSALAQRTSRTGGVVELPAKGNLTIISLQSTYDAAALNEMRDLFGSQLQYPIGIKPWSGAFSLADATSIMKTNDADVAVFLVDDRQLPMSLIAPEERWAVVNAAKLADDGVSGEAKTKRLRRALSRSFKALFSATTIEKGVMAVKTAADLDKINKDPIDGPTLFSIVHGLPSFGLVPGRRTTYKRACEEGWAPAPTNEAQKVIWDKVHAAPTKPIVIKPETKKQ